MISKMSYVEVAGPIGELDTAVDTIQDIGLLHVEEIPLAEYGDRELLHKIHLSEEKEREHRLCGEIAEILHEAVDYIPDNAVREMHRAVETSRQYEHWRQQPFDALSGSAKVLHARVRSFKRRQRNIEDDLEMASSYEEVVQALSPLVEEHELPEHYEFLGLILEHRNDQAKKLLQDELEKLSNGQFLFFEGQLSKGRLAALLGYHREFRHEVRSYVSEIGIGELNFPRHLRNHPFEEAFAMLEEELDGLKAKRDALFRQAESFYEEKGPQLIAMRHVCQDLLARFDAIGKFARTEHAFLIKGWVMKQDIVGFRSRLRSQTGSSVVLRELRRHEASSPPVVLRNPKGVRNFEPLLSILPAPQYGSVDPTSLLALFFPPIFGLMLGDVGYGLLILLIAGLVSRAGRRGGVARKLSFVGAMCGLFTVGFGFLFGEFFGTLGHALGLRPLWRERLPMEGSGMSEAIITYLVIAGAVGLVHVFLGHVVGLVAAHRHGNRSEVYSNGARVAGILLLASLAGRLTGVLPPAFLWVGVVLAAVFTGVMALQVAQQPAIGLLLPLEVLSSMGNIFSYARIMAIGMASVVLAFLANMFGGMVGNVVVAVLVAVMIHSLNLVLGIVDPTIQGLRLHYVEFFSKFYTGGGKPYQPFRRQGNRLATAA